MTVMIKGSVVNGTEREIVRYLRDHSYERETKREYKQGVQRRAEILHQEEVSVETCRTFLQDLDRIGEITIIEG